MSCNVSRVLVTVNCRKPAPVGPERGSCVKAVDICIWKCFTPAHFCFPRIRFAHTLILHYEPRSRRPLAQRPINPPLTRLSLRTIPWTLFFQKLHVFLFQEVLVITRAVTHNEQLCYQLYRQPIPVKDLMLEDLQDGEVRLGGSLRGAFSNNERSMCG